MISSELKFFDAFDFTAPDIYLDSYQIAQEASNADPLGSNWISKSDGHLPTEPK